MELTPQYLAQLGSLIALLRDSGITTYRNGDLELSLGAAPQGEEIPHVSDDARDVLADPMANLPESYRRAFTTAAQ